MDEATKGRFKWKFYKLTLVLNVIVLLVAFGVIALFKAPFDLNIPFSLGLFIAAVALSALFMRMYRVEKAWLNSQP
ncbi:hypothetical protein [Methanosphaerula palustris]|uniref:Uncharacterized protein n=1 Tax=Methanosphaerula palustris (strain ATCC BAA-1556 / DSM 19958 / E1-9c) TaxID=521011 RepID=B8GF50_METPE|nr:hypothetical protein [Methanosphaerula palustris]ACL17856.1 conserved hypothetical protein [Methanosphaerula palustris E1-9c]